MQLASSASGPRYATTPLWLTWAAATSLGLHGLAWVALGFAPTAAPERREQSEVSFEIAKTLPTAEPPAVPAPEREPEGVRAPERTAPSPPQVARPEEKPPAAATEAKVPEAIDMSGVTLTNDLGGGFSMHSGNGLAREGALRVPASLVRTAPRERPSASLDATGPRIVSLGDLSARPSPPALQSALERNYPADARRRGLSGTATVRVRIDSDGLVRTATSIDESSWGFGEACRRTLRGSRWSAPRDRGGNAVATEVRYTCRFVVTP